MSCIALDALANLCHVAAHLYAVRASHSHHDPRLQVDQDLLHHKVPAASGAAPQLCLQLCACGWLPEGQDISTCCKTAEAGKLAYCTFRIHGGGVQLCYSCTNCLSTCMSCWDCVPPRLANTACLTSVKCQKAQDEFSHLLSCLLLLCFLLPNLLKRSIFWTTRLWRVSVPQVLLDNL